MQGQRTLRPNSYMFFCRDKNLKLRPCPFLSPVSIFHPPAAFYPVPLLGLVSIGAVFSDFAASARFLSRPGSYLHPLLGVVHPLLTLTHPKLCSPMGVCVLF